MRSLCVVVAAPFFDNDLSLLKGVEDFPVEQFISHPPVKAFTVSVLPRAAWLDVGGL